MNRRLCRVRVTRRRAHVLLLSVAGSFAAFPGCDTPEDPNRPVRVPATGVVMFRNEPLAGATVIFTPIQEGNGAVGLTDEAGEFELQTFDPGDGAVPGNYRVAIRKFVIETGGTAGPGVEVSDDGGDLSGNSGRGGDGGGYEPKPAVEKSLIPERYGKVETSGLDAVVSEGSENAFTFNLTN